MLQNIDFRSIQPSLSEINSFKLYIELFTTKTSWRCYSKSSVELWELEKIINRYIKSHASVPSPLTQETLSSTPMHVLQFLSSDNTTQITGLVYANGLVCEAFNTQSLESELILLVEDKVAEIWSYPSKYIYPARFFQQKEDN